MKIMLFSLLLFTFCSCSKSDEDTFFNKPYVYCNDTLQVNMSFGESGKAHITVYINEHVAYQDLYNASYSGTYPFITFKSERNYPWEEELVMDCSFSSSSQYDTTIKSCHLIGTLLKYYGREFDLPIQMRFTEGTGILDEDADGILDNATL